MDYFGFVIVCDLDVGCVVVFDYDFFGYVVYECIVWVFKCRFKIGIGGGLMMFFIDGCIKWVKVFLLFVVIIVCDGIVCLMFCFDKGVG